jgi:ABC-2 type transport system permease protein
VNSQQLRAFLWLRWHLRINQLRRGGIVNAVILAVLTAGAVVVACGLFAGALLVGVFVLGSTEPSVLLYVWDGIAAAFLFCWMIGLITDLQRAESLSLEKFLHLPVSLAGVFLTNYVSSLFSLNLIVFVPAMVGLSIGLVISRGPALLVQFPLVAAFLLVVTALTYQFQGWLAALMVNPRRRRTVIVFATMILILLCQLPNMVNIYWSRHRPPQGRFSQDLEKKQQRLNRARARNQITAAELQKQQEEIDRDRQAEANEQAERERQQTEHTIRLINLCLPPGWLPLGITDGAEGNYWPALLGTLGLGAIGVGSLWRSYRTTVRLYTGQFTSGRRKPVAAVAAATTAPARPLLVERSLPGLTEYAAATALAGFRSLVRAPEAKMMLLSPIVLVVVFGSMLLARPPEMPEPVRPLLAFGVMAVALLNMVQLTGNQFGFDRGGFRVFVLCPAPRRDILLGKNLAIAPLALGLGLIGSVFVEVLFPMRVEHLLALMPQLLSMYFLSCLLANVLSILTPMPIPAGALRPSNVTALPVLLQMSCIAIFPLVLSPTLLPLGLEFLLEQLGWIQKMPVCLMLCLLEFAVVFFLYRLVLSWQGSWLLAREQKILQVVASKERN